MSLFLSLFLSLSLLYEYFLFSVGLFFFAFSYSLWWLKVFCHLKYKNSLWSFQNVDLYSNLLGFFMFISYFVFQSLKCQRFKVHVCTCEINVTEQSVPWSVPWNVVNFVLMTFQNVSLFLTLEDNICLLFPKDKDTSVLPGIFVQLTGNYNFLELMFHFALLLLKNKSP